MTLIVMYNGRGHGGYSFTPREIFTGGTNFERDGENFMFTPREIFTGGTRFERDGGNVVFNPHENFTWRTNFERDEINIISIPCKKLQILKGEVQIFKGCLQILILLRTITLFLPAIENVFLKRKLH